MLSPRSLPWILLGLALALAFLTHAAALGFPFADDDTTQIVGEPHIRSWHFLPQYFTQDIWIHRCGSNYYRPAFLTWLLVNYTLFGLEPMGWHATAILVHLLATGMVYALAAKLCRHQIAAGFAALIFAVHPVSVEAVAWVSGVNEPLMTVLFIASMLCYFQGRERQKAGWQWASALFFLAAILVKETAIILPLLVLLYEWRPGPGLKREISSSKPVLASYAAAVLVYLAGRAAALHGLVPAHGSHFALPVVLSTWPAALWFYLKELVVPWPLGLYHTLPLVTRHRWQNFYLPICGLLAGSAALAACSRRMPSVARLCAWVVLPLLPVLVGLSSFERGQLVHNRYLYLPLAGFSILCALALRQLPFGIARFRSPVSASEAAAPEMHWPWIQFAAVSAVVGILAVAAVVNTDTWSDNQTLYRHAVAVAPGNAAANVSWAQELAAEEQPEAALAFYRQAVALDPDDSRTYYSLGFFQARLKQWHEAERSLVKVTQLKPDEPCLFFGLALIQEEAGDLSPAEASFRRACAAPPVAEGAHYEFALLLEREGRIAEARAQLKAELAIAPDSEARAELDRLNRRTRDP
jgi:cytochrome c-type biogenesis protein CcmH/NrfG